MILSPSQHELVLTIFTLKRKRRIETENLKDRDEADLQDVLSALETASLVIVPLGVIEALKNTISDLNGKLQKAQTDTAA